MLKRKILLRPILKMAPLEPATAGVGGGRSGSVKVGMGVGRGRSGESVEVGRGPIEVGWGRSTLVGVGLLKDGKMRPDALVACVI